MKPVTQSKTGDVGTCFRSCLASILELRESEVPDINDFAEAGWQGAVDDFLWEHGLRYRRVPIGGAKPAGYSTIEGVSPRGGLHACVALDGELVHDPHPEDGTGRGLVEPRYYGLLESIGTGSSIDHTARGRDRADMMQLRRNTERQGGPFFIQETEKDGTERTIPVRDLRKY